ncbi:RNA polymerase sigma-70 factor [Rhodocaloribacter litoris]|uniref:RNA polymerase sigma-70 factor n=1 Tax=Rhodocaloribacter litoris TaxID=2558931 RepID=UPI00141D866C|nr:RNA polymerase sigma-70 factor [Rhodocaloribacter litoris]QXD14833.1 RNA polymerase sigma-70 factor [Rhodocaloribacter litoris]GIV59076.1 MAG: DNA-directed RNA polymerase sigma-70 factor [Rhodothermaceae bacterium]
MQSISEDQFRAWSDGLRRSDRAAYASVFDATYDALFRFAWYITHDQEACYDILQDVYAKLWRIREQIDPDRSLKALLYQMVRNYALNHERQKRRHATTPLDGLPVEPSTPERVEEDLDAAALQNRLHAWIAEMPERRRLAFSLSRFEGLSHEEIAERMNLAPKTVNNHIVLALQYLRERLQEYRAQSESLRT